MSRGTVLLRLLLVLGFSASLGGPAWAKSAVTLGYATGDVWAAAVRLLRVDRNLPVREKDEAAGYVLFDVTEGGKTYRASLELVALTDEAGRASTQATLTIAQLPKRFEAALLDQLAAKVRDERGLPPPRKPAAPRVEPNDVGKNNDAKTNDTAKAHPTPDGGLPRPPTWPSP
jgi:hypothetical protein